MVRGKSDKADARFISKYGWMRKDELKPMTPPSDAQVALQQLMSHRDKLVADKSSYQCKLKELRGIRWICSAQLQPQKSSRKVSIALAAHEPS